jgi:hypothetical protein
MGLPCVCVCVCMYAAFLESRSNMLVGEKQNDSALIEKHLCPSMNMYTYTIHGGSEKEIRKSHGFEADKTKLENSCLFTYMCTRISTCAAGQ